MYAKCFFFVFLASSSAKVAYETDSIVNLLDIRELKPTELTKIKAPEDIKAKVPTNPIQGTETTSNKTCVDPSIADNVIDSNVELCKPKVKVDNGTALILTPYIEEGRIDEARNASRVDPEVFLGVKSYSGFLTVNKTYNSNLFFWYFPIPNKPVNQTPWVIWLQGGPGASSMTGLFDEIGPFSVNSNNTLVRNEYTWLKNHSLVFIENPVGTGYSFTEHSDGYARDMNTYSTHLYTTLKQFIQLFPELRSAPLYIAGESYAGKYVPALAMEVLKHKDTPGHDLNFQGIILGNAFVDPIIISNISANFYYFGLLDSKQYEIIRPIADRLAGAIADNKSVEAKNKWTSLVSLILLMTNLKQGYNYLKEDLTAGRYYTFLSRSEVKRALHVGDINFSFVNVTANMQLAPDFLSTTRPYLEWLLDNYKVLTYCGQLDQLLGCIPSAEFYRSLNWSLKDQFLNSTRYPFRFQKKLAGYDKTGGGLTEVLVRGAGHMAALDAPGPVQKFIAQWTHGLRIGTPIAYMQNSFITSLIRNSTSVNNTDSVF